MRVVHLVRTYLFRTETFIYSQLAHLPPEKAVVLTRELQHLDRFPGANVRAFDQEPKTFSKRWSDMNYRALKRMTNYERQFYSRELSTLEPDLLHAHFAVDAAYFAAVWEHLHQPLVVSCYGYDVSSFPNRYGGWGHQYLYPVWRSAALVLAMSNDMREDLTSLGCPDEKIRVHYYGIDLDRFQYVKREQRDAPIRILFVGALTERKGVKDVLDAFAQITKECPNLELRFVGSGPLSEKLEQQARACGLENKVSFAGFVRHEDLPAELSRAEIFCHPSRTLKSGDKEGIPGTIIEAMATGLPVVTTKHAGIPEMVRDGVDGFVVAERDVAAIAQALLTCIRRPELRALMGSEATRRANEKANAVPLTAELEDIYDEVIGKYSARSI